MSHEDLRELLAQLPKAPEQPQPGRRTETLVVDKKVIASRLIHLQQRGLILYTVEFNPSRDVFKDWVYREISEKLRIRIEQIKVVT